MRSLAVNKASRTQARSFAGGANLITAKILGLRPSTGLEGAG